MPGWSGSTVPAGPGNGSAAIPIIRRERTARSSGRTERSCCLPVAAIPCGGFSFAEDPALPATEARILFARAADPHVLPCEAVTGAARDGDVLRMGCFSAVLLGEDPGEQILLSDGLHNLRLEIRHGSLLAGPVQLRFHLQGLSAIDPPLLALRRLAAFHRLGRMPGQLYPPDPRIGRAILALRAWDAHSAGASQREIAAMLFGGSRAAADWQGPSDYLHSQVKRLLRKGRAMVRGDWRRFLRGARG